MENEIIKKGKNYMLPLSIVIVGTMLSGAIAYSANLKANGPTSGSEQRELSRLEEKVLPEKGVALPVVWGDLRKQLFES